MRIDTTGALRTLLALALWASASLCSAQQDDGIQFPSEKANLDCMLPVAAELGEPVYPPAAFVNKKNAKVRVVLTFTSADKPPRADITTDEDSSEFKDAVRDYVKRYRLPCFKPNQVPVRTTQQFDFQSEDGRPVVYSDAKLDGRQNFKDCVTDMQSPNYPRFSADRGIGGNVVLKMVFVQKDAPPVITVIYDGNHDWLAAAAVAAVAQYRFVCDIPTDKPLEAKQDFHFRVEGGPLYRLRDMGLREFLSMVDRADFGRINFDFKTMGCPFDLKITLLRPYAENSVGQYESYNADRKEFVEWLGQLSFLFPKKSKPYLVGESIKVSVPCMVLNIS